MRAPTRSIPIHVGFSLVLLAAAACNLAPLGADFASEDEAAGAEQGVTGETHPFQSRLVCERAPGSTLVGVMYDVSKPTRVKVTQFSSGGNVGACELAVRASRNDRVCVSNGGSGFAIRDLARGTTSGSFTTLAACTATTRGGAELRTERGFVDFITPAELAPFVGAVPSVSDPTIEQALRSPRTMWYDEASLTFVYQDSFGDPKGLRANRVGYDVGSNAPTTPDIFALTEYFQPGTFKFPFTLGAGATFREPVYALYFWLPPTGEDGAVKPVKVWKNHSHFQWVFPVGTVLGEALFQKAPDDQRWYAFEVRSRVRRIDGWTTGIFRPYTTARELADAIEASSFRDASDARALTLHLESPNALSPHTLAAPAYAKIFPPLRGAMDYLPAIDPAHAKELLTGRTFTNAMGAVWKTEGALRSYAASTRARFHVVPADYPAGLFETSETGCRKCHEHTSRPLNNLDPRVVLYGEVWGEDEIFTWHPFAIDTSTFSVADNNRQLNRRLVTAGLVEMGAPASEPATYRALPKPYVPTYE